jgi:hypothetical protein
MAEHDGLKSGFLRQLFIMRDYILEDLTRSYRIFFLKCLSETKIAITRKILSIKGS